MRVFVPTIGLLLARSEQNVSKFVSTHPPAAAAWITVKGDCPALTVGFRRCVQSVPTIHENTQDGGVLRIFRLYTLPRFHALLDGNHWRYARPWMVRMWQVMSARLAATRPSERRT